MCKYFEGYATTENDWDVQDDFQQIENIGIIFVVLEQFRTISDGFLIKKNLGLFEGFQNYLQQSKK